MGSGGSRRQRVGGLESRESVGSDESESLVVS